MLKSPAWRSLSLMARCLLLEVWQRYNGQNNGGIAYSVREAARALGVGKNTPTKLFREFEDKGFLKARQRGSFHWKGGEATTWVLTTERCGEKPATKELMSWQPTGEKQKPVPHTGTNGPPQRDRDPQTSRDIHPHGPPQRDHAPR